MTTPDTRGLRRIALRTTLIYVIVAGVWIVTSDSVVALLTSDAEVIAELSIAKGWFFVLVTGTLVYTSLRRQLGRVEAETEARQHAVTELSDQRWRLDNIIEGTRVGTWEWNVQTGAIVFNERWAAMIGYTLEELAPVSIATWERLAHREDLAESGRLLKRHFNGEIDFYEMECRLRHKDGRWIWVHDCGRLQSRDAAGQPLMMFGTHTDITARKLAEFSRRESEERQRMFFEHAPAALAMFDREMRFLAVSRRWLEDYGLVGTNLIGRSHDAIFPDLPERLQEVYRRGQRGEVIRADADYFERSDGRGQWLRWEVRPWRDAMGEIGGIAIFSEDITTGIQADEALRASEERFRAVVEASPAAIFIQVKQCFTYLNPAAMRLFGAASPADLVGHPVLDRVHPESRAVAAERMDAINEKGQSQSPRILQVMRLDGTSAQAEVMSVPFVHEGRRGALVFGHDVTEKMRAEEQLRLHESVLRETGEIAKVGGWSFDPITGEGYWTDEVARIHDMDPSDPTSREVGLKYYEKESRVRIESAISAAIERAEPYDLVLEMTTAKGRRKWVRTIGHPVVEQGRVVRVRGAFQDITDQHVAGDALRESEERFRQIAENINEVFWILEGDSPMGPLSYVSPAYDVVWGRSRAALIRGDHTWPDTIHPEDRERILHAIETRATAGTYNETYRIVHPGGAVRWIHDKAFPLRNAAGQVYRILGTAEDMTERHNLEEQFRQAQKMEAIGTLAGGIAHDFNNLLGAMMGFAELTRSLVHDQPAVRENVEDILVAGKRAVGLVRQILAFSRRTRSEKLTMQVRPVVEEAVRLLRATIPATIEIQTSFGRAVPAIVADPTQVHQLVMNLGTNAWHAMRDRPGRLEITVDRLVVDGAAIEREPRLKAGTFVRLSVRDSGVGIARDVIDRIFEPFFTTKPPGEGTGLGLSVVHGIMREHDGFVTVDSAPNLGSTFHLYFPAVEEAMEVPATAGPAALPGGHLERILVVDDEPALVRLSVQILLKLGYEPAGVEGAQEAIALFRAQPRRFDLVIVDYLMPVMTGIGLIKALRQIRPDLRAILVTGHAGEITHEALVEQGFCDLLIKPLSLADLAAAVRAALGSRKKSPP